MRLKLTRPDDWHLHLRDGAALAAVTAHVAARFGRAIVMPNLRPPVTTGALANAYRERIRAALPRASGFTPLMTLFLTDNTDPADVARAASGGVVHAVKYYPAGATTNADAGVSDIARAFAVLARMEEIDLPLLLHGELSGADIDAFDRERLFIDRILADLTRRFPRLRLVFEHVTTREAVEFVLEQGPNVAATITPQHLLLNRNALFEGGLRPHHYCLPVLKRESHRLALVAAATGGSAKFFLGTDSAPHPRRAKEAACGCAGVYTSHAGIELYAEAFEAAGQLGRLEAFASFHGADFYRLPRNTDAITLEKASWSPPPSYPFDNDELVPFRAGETLAWRLTPAPR
jgi:dihydroorotase